MNIHILQYNPWDNSKYVVVIVSLLLYKYSDCLPCHLSFYTKPTENKNY